MIRLPALLALPALAACGGAGQGERVEPAPALAARCGAQAEPIFHCTVADGRVLSVCVATGDGGAPRVRYSFRRGAAHLVLPTPEGPPPRFATVPYSGGGEAQVGQSLAVGMSACYDCL